MIEYYNIDNNWMLSLTFQKVIFALCSSKKYQDSVAENK